MIPIIIFDGHSGSGKTTLRYKLFYQMNFDVLTVDRFTPSMWVYDFLRNIDREIEIKKFENKFDFNFMPLLIICECSAIIAENRVQKNSLRKKLFSIINEKAAFEIYLREICQFSNVLKLNTNNSIEDCISKILEKI